MLKSKEFVLKSPRSECFYFTAPVSKKTLMRPLLPNHGNLRKNAAFNWKNQKKKYQKTSLLSDLIIKACF